MIAEKRVIKEMIGNNNSPGLELVRELQSTGFFMERSFEVAFFLPSQGRYFHVLAGPVLLRSGRASFITFWPGQWIYNSTKCMGFAKILCCE